VKARLPPVPFEKNAINVLLLSVAVPEKLQEAPGPARAKDKLQDVPEGVPVTGPVAGSELRTSHAKVFAVRTPSALTVPEKELPVCVGVHGERPAVVHDAPAGSRPCP
jgi:hypothetical protein